MTRKLCFCRGLATLALLAFLAAPALAEDVVHNDGDPTLTTPINLEGSNDKIENYLAPSGSDAGKSNSLSGNSVTLNSGTVSNVLGGININDSAAVTNNKVIINGGLVTGTVDGASGDYAIIGGRAYIAAGSAAASGNSITVNGGTVTGEILGGWVSGGGDAMTASGNSVVINGGTVTATGAAIYGGYVWNQGSGTATASGNSVVINGGTVQAGYIYGSYAYTKGSGAAVASGNSIFINGDVAVSDFVAGGNATSAGGGVATATNNTVTIGNLGDLDLSGANVYGAATNAVGSDAAKSDFFTGNTLNLWNFTGQTVTVENVRNFENYNLAFPVTQADIPVLTASGNAYLDDSDSYASVSSRGRSSTVTASTIGGPAPLAVGDDVTLIQAAALKTADFDQTQAQGQHGATLRYLWDLDATTNANELAATVAKVEANPQAKALSEGFVTGQALLMQSADLMAGQGMASAVNSAENAQDRIWAGFGGVSGGSMRHDSGSHVDVDGFSLMAGLAKGLEFDSSRLTVGAFFEYGKGSYDTYNSFVNAAPVNGDGDIYHLGAGLLGRMDFAGSAIGRPYAEASFRAGGVHNEYQNGDLRDALGRHAGYETSSSYFGAHFGAGYIFNLSEDLSLDLFGKYFWTRQGSDSVTLPTGDPVHFEAVNSQRLRGGARLTYGAGQTISPYVGVAYEHELDGKAAASTYGYAIEEPSLEGGTGIAELGLNLKPAVESPFSLDLGVQGYTGQREGVTGSLRLKWDF